jgi:hypothetical protein
MNEPCHAVNNNQNVHDTKPIVSMLNSAQMNVNILNNPSQSVVYSGTGIMVPRNSSIRPAATCE